MKHCDLLLINGDSYSAYDPSTKVYGEHIANKWQVPIDNLARAGSNNDRILRSTVEAVIQHQSSGRHPFVIVGLSFVRRQEVWLTDMAPHEHYLVKEKYPEIRQDIEILPVVTLDKVKNHPRHKERFKHLVMEDFYVHKKLLDLYMSLYLFQQLLLARDIPYFIFSAARNTDCPINCFPAISHLASVKSVTLDPAIYGLHEHCVMHWAQANDPDHARETGHLSPGGHVSYGQWLQTKMEEIYGT